MTINQNISKEWQPVSEDHHRRMRIILFITALVCSAIDLYLSWKLLPVEALKYASTALIVLYTFFSLYSLPFTKSDNGEFGLAAFKADKRITLITGINVVIWIIAASLLSIADDQKRADNGSLTNADAIYQQKQTEHKKCRDDAKQHLGPIARLEAEKNCGPEPTITDLISLRSSSQKSRIIDPDNIILLCTWVSRTMAGLTLLVYLWSVMGLARVAIKNYHLRFQSSAPPDNGGKMPAPRPVQNSRSEPVQNPAPRPVQNSTPMSTPAPVQNLTLPRPTVRTSLNPEPIEVNEVPDGETEAGQVEEPAPGSVQNRTVLNLVPNPAQPSKNSTPAAVQKPRSEPSKKRKPEPAKKVNIPLEHLGAGFSASPDKRPGQAGKYSINRYLPGKGLCYLCRVDQSEFQTILSLQGAEGREFIERKIAAERRDGDKKAKALQFVAA